MNYPDKIKKLKEIIGRYKSVIIAFSGGVDSTLLARVAKDILLDRILLVTVASEFFPEFELQDAKKYSLSLDLPHKIICQDLLNNHKVAGNPVDRCYFCKKEIFSSIITIMKDEKYNVIFDGSNADDLLDYRPGMKAIEELGIFSPLKEASLNKRDIRELSREYTLPSADKPAYACLASRFPYNEKITRKKLKRVASAEAGLRKLGFSGLRVRSHNDLARVELSENELFQGWNRRHEIDMVCRKAGYNFVALDLQGYRTGSLNEVL